MQPRSFVIATAFALAAASVCAGAPFVDEFEFADPANFPLVVTPTGPSSFAFDTDASFPGGNRQISLGRLDGTTASTNLSAFVTVGSIDTDDGPRGVLELSSPARFATTVVVAYGSAASPPEPIGVTYNALVVDFLDFDGARDEPLSLRVTVAGQEISLVLVDGPTVSVPSFIGSRSVIVPLPDSTLIDPAVISQVGLFIDSPAGADWVIDRISTTTVIIPEPSSLAAALPAAMLLRRRRA